MIQLWHRPDFSAVVYNDQMKLVKNIEDIDANDIMSSVVIDLMQCSYLGFVSGDTKMCPSCKTIQEYLKIFDRIVLVNCDTRDRKSTRLNSSH